jgi:AAA+ ATPase superfamily predicted ATPase
MSFHNRADEWKVLRNALRSKRSELFILYGRRGVGKSALLEAVVSETGVQGIFYRATRRTLPLQLASLTDAAREAFPNAFLGQPFDSFGVFLDFLTHQAEAGTEPVIAVIDELPYLADVDPGLLTVIQHWWDSNKRRPNLKVFLAGSYVGFMERQVLDANAPLYNRRTGAMRLEPMDYAGAALFFPEYTANDKVAAYAVLGGMPSYLEQFDPAQTIEDNVKATALRRNTYLSEEPDWLLLEDLRRDVVYGSILRSVAAGQRKPSDIARAIGKASAQDVAPQLSMLQDLGLVVREVPVTERGRTRSRNSLYFIADNYLHFWYRYIDPARGLVARGLGDRIWETSIAPTLNEFISKPAFERVSRQYLWRAMAREALPAGLSFNDVGSWWGAGDVEIDVVAVNEGGDVVLAGSCKWTNAPVDVREYAALQNDVSRAGFGDVLYMALFSRSGFSPRLMELAAAQDPEGLLLFDVEDLFRA